MKLTLKPFQLEASQDLAERASWARRDVEERGPQTLLLAAPTGSGKTVVAVDWMEKLLNGDDQGHPPDPQATFLWITDQPELNEQTRRKFDQTSSIFVGDKLRTIDASFKSQTLDPGTVYFLNTQKLGVGKLLVSKGDERPTTIWETIQNTARERAKSFWVVIDEAHRGTATTRQERDEAKTIVQKFILGSEGELDPVPLLFGISATPDRFTALLAGTSVRVNLPAVTVEPEDVRSSGLLKEAITLFHTDEDQPSDLTLLKAAAQQTKRFAKEWKAYAKTEKATLVRPILVIQVEDGTKQKPTKTKVEEAIPIIEEVFGSLGDKEIAHSFEQDHSLEFGQRKVRYLPAADIQDDAELRTVFFKRSLTTGWDCPRAEVMMSFRRQVDPTVIAQLVGRMVRTPLARAISGQEFLNTVSLYLPHYDREALERVIEYLTEPDPDVGIPTTVQLGADLVTVKRNPKTKQAFSAAEGLPVYRVEKLSRQSNVRRLLKLGRFLAWNDIDKKASDRYRKALVTVLDGERKKVAGKKAFEDQVQQAAVIDVREVTIAYGETDVRGEAGSALEVVERNIEHAFDEAGRRLGGGLNADYLATRAKARDKPPVSRIKQELFALSQDSKVITAVEEAARQLLAADAAKHQVAVRGLPDEKRQIFRQIRRHAATPEPEPWELPASIEAPRNGNKKYKKHLYATRESFPAKLNRWEDEVISAAVDDDKVIGWLRNDPRKDWSFSVPYKKGAEDRPMYPDFLIFRKQGGGIVCDIIEPHSLAWEDTVAKAKGLAEFAKAHGDEFGRIELIANLKGRALKSLRLDDESTRNKVLAVSTGDELRARFEES